MIGGIAVLLGSRLHAVLGHTDWLHITNLSLIRPAVQSRLIVFTIEFQLETVYMYTP
jgi:hypothetical protein